MNKHNFLFTLLFLLASLCTSILGDQTNISAQSPAKQLLELTKKGDVEEIEKFLEQIKNLLYTKDISLSLFSSGRPFFADSRGYIEVGSSNMDSDGNSLLHLAAERGMLFLVEKLISFCVEKNTQNKQGETPLFMATKNNHVEIFRTLMQEGANSSIDCNGTTVAHVAAKNGDVKILEEIAKYRKALFFTPDNNGDTPLIVARDNEQYAAAQCLIKYDDQYGKDKFGKSLLHFAVEKNIIDLITSLLKEYADKPDLLDMQDNDGNTPLHIAVIQDHTFAVECLLNHDALCSIRNNDGNTAEDLARIYWQESFTFFKAQQNEKERIKALYDDVDRTKKNNRKTEKELQKYAQKGFLDALPHYEESTECDALAHQIATNLAGLPKEKRTLFLSSLVKCQEHEKKEQTHLLKILTLAEKNKRAHETSP
ncbi:MAG TPA: ankyrin repeat domain-containing protein [Candidatus Bathyarchaeia archaeon]|nr:ankyrin repeat domain-containing protein [Candidatus Bathyarchaeia archaeon]